MRNTRFIRKEKAKKCRKKMSRDIILVTAEHNIIGRK